MRDEPKPWVTDPIVWAGAAFGAGATAFAVFAGRYLPYIDWAAHLGLISVLANGSATGALEFFDRSFAPGPYLLFYLLTAIVAQVVPVDIAAKVVLCLTAAGLVLSTASLAEATGRSPRIGLVAPLAMFGLSMGWGFGSFVLATPIMFFVLSGAERTIRTADASPTVRSGLREPAVWWLAASAAFLYLAHGFLFVVTFGIVGLRAILHAIAAARARCSAAVIFRPIAALSIAAIPALALMLPATIALVGTPTVEAGVDHSAKLFEWTPFAQHLQSLGGDMLERGSEAHWTVMYWTVALFAVWLAASIFRRHPAPLGVRGYGLEIYAALLVALYLFGPMTVSWPSSIWMIYPRFGVIAALSVLLLPRVELRGVLGLPLALASLVLVGANAKLNGDHTREFSVEAAPYDRVRQTIPKGQRVLALTVIGPHERQLRFHASGSLWAYLMVDGASYVAFMFDKNELPVHARRDRPAPRAPVWTSPASFDPRTQGLDYDYLVLRGELLIRRTNQAGLHELVADIDGWTIFKTKAPNPRPSPS